LLLGIVAAVALTLRKRKDTKHLNPSLAIKVQSKDRLRIVKMQSEVRHRTDGAEKPHQESK
jgi:NADH-quinone oxidoreductase subunit J